ncbi:MAG: sugar transferase [Candidatus Omnitrophota bacterium]|nr:sugar transferase [Candidatus Omnitrophota bacterium]
MAQKIKKSVFNFCMLCLIAAGIFLLINSRVYATPISSVSSLSESTITRPESIDTSQTSRNPRSHAPEASSFILFSTGIMGYLIRFARRRFQEFKRGFDVVVSVIGLIITSPLILSAAILTKIISPKGTVFFRQERVGKNGAIFYIFKLRTMRPDAEKATGAVWAKENDPRLIPFIGKLFRKGHIDELPQLINVLHGEMSIVGPRPERPEFVVKLKEVIPDYEKRLAVNPGITGLAQVWHKYDETIEDVKKKIKYDLLYIRKMCLMVDIRILFKTMFVVLTGQGAR